MITESQLKALTGLLESGEERSFYSWTAWKRVRKKVLDLDREECQICKSKGRYSPATIVHHVNHLRDRPDLALSVWDPDTGKRNLISLCKRCHELQHPEALRKFGWAVIPVTTERWD